MFRVRIGQSRGRVRVRQLSGVSITTGTRYVNSEDEYDGWYARASCGRLDRQRHPSYPDPCGCGQVSGRHRLHRGGNRH
jgi:hypothetical protein